MNGSILLGIVKGFDKNFTKEEHIIRVDVPEVNDEVEAIPMNSLDEPTIGDEVVLFPINSQIGNTYLYMPLRKFKDNYPFNGARFNGGVIEMHKDGKISISNNDSDLFSAIKKLIVAIMELRTIEEKGLNTESRHKLNKVAGEFDKLLTDTKAKKIS